MTYMTLRDLKKLTGKLYIQVDTPHGMVWMKVTKKFFFAQLEKRYHSSTLFKVSLDSEDKEILFFGAANE